MRQSAPWLAGVRSRCPQCGEGKLFRGFLTLADQCALCGTDFRNADTGDGPAFFVMFVVGALAVPLAFVLRFGLHVDLAFSLALTAVVAVVLSLALLRLAKGLLFALQWRHRLRDGV